MKDSSWFARHPVWTVLLGSWAVAAISGAAVDIIRAIRAPMVPKKPLRPSTTSTSSTAARPPSTGRGTGADALAVAVGELGIAEDAPKSHTGKRVREYLAGCVRDGKPLGLTEGNWCAAFVGWCDRQANVTGPCLWRAAVHELVTDARAQDAWHPAGDGYAPKPGDLAVFKRDADDPTKGGKGHVGRVETPPDAAGDFRSLEGNYYGGPIAKVARVNRSATSSGLVGWIDYSHPTT